MTSPLPRRGFVMVVAFAGALGALVGAAAGSLHADGPSGTPAIGPGAVLGAVLGLACGVISARVDRLRGLWRDASGVAAGALVGILVSVAVRAALGLWFGPEDAPAKLFFGLVAGLLVGGILGLPAGAAWKKALVPERRRLHLRPGPPVADNDLSRAVVVVLGFRTRNHPTRDDAALSELFGPARAPALATAVQAILQELPSLEVDWSKHDLASAGDEVARTLAARHPDLTDEALEALAWTFTFDWR